MKRHIGVRNWWLPAILALLTVVGAAQTRTVVESTRPIPSPDGTRQLIVDHISRIIDGAPERYSGRMVVRISDAGGTVTHQRRIDASQVRLINPPMWLDEHWAAFTYNISKNANGVVYMNSETGEAVQIEFVAFTRRMAATDTFERELTSFEATLYGRNVVRVANITRGGRSVFPLLLRPLPPYDTNPFPLVFAEQVRTALLAYQNVLAVRQIEEFRMEEATESFNPEETHMAVLACVNGKPSLVIATLKAEDAADALGKMRIISLDSALDLTCLREPPDAAQEATPAVASADTMESETLGHFGEFRYRTAWRDSQTVLVQKEIFETEEQEPYNVTLYEATVEGSVRRLQTPTTSSREMHTTVSFLGTHANEQTTLPATMEGRQVQATPAANRALGLPKPSPKPKATPRTTKAEIAQPSARSKSTPRPRSPTRVEAVRMPPPSRDTKSGGKNAAPKSPAKLTPGR